MQEEISLEFRTHVTGKPHSETSEADFKVSVLGSVGKCDKLENNVDVRDASVLLSARVAFCVVDSLEVRGL